MEGTADDRTGVDMLLTLKIAPLIEGKNRATDNEKEKNRGKSVKRNSLFNNALGKKTNDKNNMLNCIIGPRNVR